VLEHVLGALLEGVLVVDATGRRVYANEEAARLTGYPSVAALLEAPPEEAAARFEIRDRSGRPVPPAELPGRRALAGADAGPMLVRFRSGDGPERVSEVRSVAVCDEDGRRTYVITYFREVTEQIAAADEIEALYHHAERTTALLDALYVSAPVGLGFWDRNLRYVRVNNALARINERPAEDHVGRTFREVVPQLADELEAIARGVLETGEPVIGLEMTAGTPTSPRVLRHWSASYYPVFGSDGVPIGVGAVVEETTQRRRAEERERAARAEVEAAAATLRKLERVSQVALEHLSLQDLLDALLARIVEVLEADTAAILLVEADGKLHVRATVGGLTGDSAIGIPIGAGMAGRVAATREPLLVPDLSKIDLYRSTLRQRGINSIVAIPLVVEDRVIGVVHAGSEAYAQFVEDDARLLELIADRIALAINQASLYEAEEAAQERLRFLGEAGALLGSSLDVEKTLEQLGALVAGRIADWCSIHLVAETTGVRLVSVAHRDETRTADLRTALSERAAEARIADVVASGRPAIDARSLVVPLNARGRTFGAMSLGRDAEVRQPEEPEVEFALDIARRAAIAIDNAQLYGAAAERAQAARVLASVGDGVFLVDRAGVIRTWNRAAAIATSLPASAVVDRPAAEAIPGWSAIVSRIAVASAGSAAPRPESLPLDVGGREVWLSIHGVAVPDGVVYAFRDLTEERVLERMRTEFVSTVSHELRTPLAAIYGAAMTLRRSDVALDDEQRTRLLDIVSGEADRLARTVNDILWASRLDTDTLNVTIQNCDPVALVDEVVTAQEVHLDRAHRLVVEADSEVPLVAGDPDKVGRVLINLVDNAVKYSPDGGNVTVKIAGDGSHVRFSVVDEGLGIPPAEHRRVFEKFYRLDPNMTGGVGGTGLGLYICRELVRRMDGRIWVESPGLGRGSTFIVELPAASAY
jgi:signal transduction histidine kinase/putative methionine-R-sulfoxide reductase with GAF domain